MRLTCIEDYSLQTDFRIQTSENRLTAPRINSADAFLEKSKKRIQLQKQPLTLNHVRKIGTGQRTLPLNIGILLRWPMVAVLVDNQLPMRVIFGSLPHELDNEAFLNRYYLYQNYDTRVGLLTFQINIGYREDQASAYRDRHGRSAQDENCRQMSVGI